jgi:hypothetical protein
MARRKGKLFYREDIAGLWVFLDDGSNEVLLTERPIRNAHTITVVKRYVNKVEAVNGANLDKG